jgi:hypothetical protein
MTEHQIRLRRGWECREADAPDPEVRRLDLPVRWSSEIARRLVLTRRFGRPAVEPGRQVLILRLDQVVGTRAIILNGQTIASASAETTHYAIELADLAERNVLVLEIETPPQDASPVENRQDWGVIALVIRDTDHSSVRSGPGVVEQIDLQ